MRFSDRSFAGMFWELYLKAVSWVKVGLFLSWDLRLIFRCDAALRLHFSVRAGSHCFNVPKGRLWFIYPGFVSCVSSPSLYSSAQKGCWKIWEATFDLIRALCYIDMLKMIWFEILFATFPQSWGPGRALLPALPYACMISVGQREQRQQDPL